MMCCKVNQLQKGKPTLKLYEDKEHMKLNDLVFLADHFGMNIATNQEHDRVFFFLLMLVILIFCVFYFEVLVVSML